MEYINAPRGSSRANEPFNRTAATAPLSLTELARLPMPNERGGPDMSEQEIQDRALSVREEEVALLAAEGLTDKEIADRLGLSPGTLRTYWERTRAKLGAKTRSH